MSALDKCINRLIVLEGEVNYLRSKIEDGQEWRERMEDWFRNRFQYDPNNPKSSSFDIETEDDEVLLLPSASSISVTPTSSASISKSRGYRNLIGTGTAAASSSSITTKRQTKSSNSQSKIQNAAGDYSSREESISISNVGISSSWKRGRNFITESVEIERVPADIVTQDDVISWELVEEPEEIKIEPCFRVEQSYSENDGQRIAVSGNEDDGVNVCGNQWEVYNPDEVADIADTKFSVIGYDNLRNEPKNDGINVENLVSYEMLSCEERKKADHKQTARASRTTKTPRKKSTTLHLHGQRLSNSNTATKPNQLMISKSRRSSSYIKKKSKTVSKPSKVYPPNRVKSTKTGIKKNIQPTNNTKTVDCPYCLKLFNSLAEMMRHQRIHVGDKPFTCYLCHYATSFNGDLVRHLKTRHPGMDAYVCHICGFKCNDRYVFNDHRLSSGHRGRNAKPMLLELEVQTGLT